MALLSVGLILLTCITAIPVLTLVLQIIAAAFATQKGRDTESLCSGTVAVLVPAHNEAQTIASTIRWVLGELTERDKLLVIADNCSDKTAELAKAEGAEVIERNDPERRGKGYALDYAREYLSRSPPDVVMVVDADCVVSPSGIRLMAARCYQTNRPIQAAYHMKNREGASTLMKVAEFASLIKCVVRPLGNSVLGMPTQLMGTGMAIPWKLFAEHQKATGHIVEDLKLGLELARADHYPSFQADVQVFSYFPETSAGAKSQRTRWEHGHLGVILADGPRIMLDALKKRRPKLLAVGLDLMVPPTALLAAWLAFLSLLAGNMLLFSGASQVFWAVLCVDGFFFAGMTWAWWRYARHILAPQDFIYVPLYALAKLPIYLRFLFKPQSDWVRTERKRDSR